MEVICKILTFIIGLFIIVAIIFILTCIICNKILEEKDKSELQKDNEEYDYGHNVGHYHSDGND